MRIIKTFCFAGIMLVNHAFAQSPHDKLGQKALMEGKFKEAVVHLEKAYLVDSSNVNVLWMLGYSYYHAGNMPKSISTFNRLLVIKPNELNAYYYRGKARCTIATDGVGNTMTEKESNLLSGIRDFSKAIELNAQDAKLYQNRGIAYKDYAILRSQKVLKPNEKIAVSNYFKSAINDFQKVLDLQPQRRDMQGQIDYVKQQLLTLK